MTEPGETTYAIGKLAEAAGTTPRTIRYYAAEGLLPPPRSEGRYALYSDAHLLRLRLIQKLKNAFLPLGTIREQIAGLTDAQIETLLGNGETAQETPDSGEKRRLRPGIQVSEPNVGQSGFDRIAQILAVTGQGAALENSGATDRPKRALLVSPIFRPEPPAQSPFDPPNRADETWRRIAVAPGIELHLRQPVAPEIWAQVETVRKLFGANPTPDEKGGKT